jgi:aryl-phospho-beta-D-glucosidase BglC (GH1 family)
MSHYNLPTARRLGVLALACAGLFPGTATHAAEPVHAAARSLPMVHQDGTAWVDAGGRRLDLRGVNLGNWLAMEFWMLGESVDTAKGKVPDQCTLERTLAARFGAPEKERLMALWHDSWITARDFDRIAALGMNVVRVPFLYDVVENDAAPMTLRADAWKYLDFAVDEAEKRGIYVILDLHGAVGGQAAPGEQHDGCVGPAAMWTTPAYRERTRWLWGQIAARYKDRGAVLAYDLLNEPWGTDPDTMAAFARELYDVVRAKDAAHVVLLPSHNSNGYRAYVDPHARGMQGVAFWMHPYPGFWGWHEGGGPQKQADRYQDWLRCTTGDDKDICAWNAELKALDMPFLVGEFQPWALLGAWGGQTTRNAYDAFNALGWAGTAWAYKRTTPAGSDGSEKSTADWGWGLVTNDAAGGAYGRLNASTASVNEIEAWFKAFGTQPLVTQPDVARWMRWTPAVGARIDAAMFDWHPGPRVATGTDADGGFDVTDFGKDGRLGYTLDVPAAGDYTVRLRVASARPGARLAIMRGDTVLARTDAPAEGGAGGWTTVQARVHLPAGRQTLTLASTGPNADGLRLHWWRLDAAIEAR